MPTIRDEAGFVAYFVLSAGRGGIGSVSIFEDQQSAEESNRKSEEWVSEDLSGPHTSAELRRWGSRARLWPFFNEEGMERSRHRVGVRVPRPVRCAAVVPGILSSPG